jgi:hypothetical protein
MAPGAHLNHQPLISDANVEPITSNKKGVLSVAIEFAKSQ